MNCSIHFELSKTKANNTDFRTGKPVNTSPDWNDHVTSSANHYTRISVRNQYYLYTVNASKLIEKYFLDLRNMFPNQENIRLCFSKQEK